MTTTRKRSGELDWAGLHERLDAALAAIDREAEGEAAHAILAARARRLARRPERETPEETLLAAEFVLAGERYAVEAARVEEVFRLARMTPLPGAEPPVVGVTARRGDLLALVDLRGLLGLSPTALNDLARVLVIAGEPQPFGVLTDAVPGVVRVPVGSLAPPPEGGRLPRRFVRGVTPDALTILDSEALARLLR